MTLETFLFDTPIYSPITITAENQKILNSLATYGAVFDGYNPWQKTQSTFSISQSLPSRDTVYFRDGGITRVEVICKRYGDEFNFYILWIPEKSLLSKVGQFPSVADFHIGEIKQYKQLLNEEKLREFTRAIGLAANGVGIGSFVYLRRIFEHLISEAYQVSLRDGSITEGDYQKAKMDEKIGLLQAYLPTFLYDNKIIYSLLSLGIHELDEITCLAHFDTLKVAIEIILDEKLDELRKKEKIEAAKKKLTELKGNIKK
jgi:hypothetical protein